MDVMSVPKNLTAACLRYLRVRLLNRWQNRFAGDEVGLIHR